MFTKKQSPDHNSDLIDLLLSADPPTRKLLILKALQTGALRKSEAEDLLALVARLERAAAPWTEADSSRAALPAA